MAESRLLEGKKILVVDDEPDVLETLESLLPMCEVKKATNFEDAKAFLETEPFDMAILDIMGVEGYTLLDLANEKGVLAAMLTAHALTPDNVKRSFTEGAASFIPKEAMSDITVFLEDILEAKARGKHFWWRWMKRFSEAYLERKFGPGWKDKDSEFWEKLQYWGM